MSELNILNILNNILNNTIAAILDDYTKPLMNRIAALTDRIAGLESQADEDIARIAVLEEKLTGTRELLLELANRIAAWQDTQPTQENTAPSITEYTKLEDIKALVEREVSAAIEAHLENATHYSEDDIETAIDSRIDDHCNDYDHEQFLTEIDITEYTKLEDIKALVEREVSAAIEAHLENSPHHDEDRIEEIADNKIIDHCNDYDHDEFITEIDEDAVRDAVSDCLRDATIRLD